MDAADQSKLIKTEDQNGMTRLPLLILALDDAGEFAPAPKSRIDWTKVMESGADAVLAGVQGFSLRTRAEIEAEKMEDFCREVHRHGMKAFFNAQAMLEEKDLENSEAMLERLLAAGADAVYVSDDGWIELAMEKGCLEKIVWQPETMAASGQEAHFFEKLGVQAVSLSHELSIREIAACASASSICEVQIAGYTGWMDSRRPLLSNYFKQANLESPMRQGAVYYLQEMTRDAKMPAIEDRHGTHVFSGRPVCAFGILSDLAACGIRRLRIDGFLMGNDWALHQAETASKLLRGELQLSELESEDLKAWKAAEPLWQQEMQTRKEKCSQHAGSREEAHGKN